MILMSKVAEPHLLMRRTTCLFGLGVPSGGWRRAGAALALCLLAACATRPPAGEGAGWTSGRLSVRVDASAGKPASSVSASFDLRGSADQGELRLSSSLGTVMASARWEAGRAVLATGHGETRYADLETLSREALGEALPLRAFPDWLSGRPWAGAPSAPRTDGFEQLGWRVSLAQFAQGSLEAVRDAAPTTVVRVRLERPG